MPDVFERGDTVGFALIGDVRSHLQAVLKRKPATVNNALAAVDDL